MALLLTAMIRLWQKGVLASSDKTIEDTHWFLCPQTLISLATDTNLWFTCSTWKSQLKLFADRSCIYLKLRLPLARIAPQSKWPLKSCSSLEVPLLRASDSASETNASQWLAIIAQGNAALESKGRNDTSARRREQSYIDGERRLLVVQKMQVPPTLSLIASANYYSQRKQAIVLYPSFFTPGTFLPEMNVLYSGSNVFLLI